MNPLNLNKLKAQYSIGALLLLLSCTQISYAGECMSHLQPDGSFKPQFFGDTPYPNNWSPQDVQEYLYLGNWTCHVASLKGVQKQQSQKAFLIRSAEFAKQHPEDLEVSIWRGQWALDVDDVEVGWQTAQNLRRFLIEPTRVSVGGLSTGSFMDIGKVLLNDLKQAGWATATLAEAKANFEKDNRAYEASTAPSERLIDKMTDDEVLKRVDCGLQERTISVDRELWEPLSLEWKTQVGLAVWLYCKETEHRPTNAEQTLKRQLLAIQQGRLTSGPHLTQVELNASTKGMKDAVQEEAVLRVSPIKIEDNDTHQVFQKFDGKTIVPATQ